MPYGGEQCWPSNWVPSIWSVREMWSGDNYQLALAYFQTGLADDGWKVLRGTFPQQAMFGVVPGDMGHPSGGTDFNDCNSMFARAVVEGMFGYRPDYTNGARHGGSAVPERLGSCLDHDARRVHRLPHRRRRHELQDHAGAPCSARSATAGVHEQRGGRHRGWPTREMGSAARLRTQHESRSVLPSTGSALLEVKCDDVLKTYPSVSCSPATLATPSPCKPRAGRVVDFHDPQGDATGCEVAKWRYRRHADQQCRRSHRFRTYRGG